jgi:hypothetical protein
LFCTARLQPGLELMIEKATQPIELFQCHAFRSLTNGPESGD